MHSKPFNLHFDQQKILERYHSKIDEIDERLVSLKKQSFQYAMIRLVGMLLGLVSIYFYIKTSFILYIFSMVLFFIGFLWGVIRQTNVDQKTDYENRHKAVYENEIKVLKEKQNDYYDGASFIDPHHYNSLDLDLFGPHSLYSIINRCRTHIGINDLAQVFGIKPKREDIENRQESIKELEQKSSWVKVFFAHLRRYKKHDKPLSERVKHSLSRNLDYVSNKPLIFFQKSQPILWIGLIIAWYFNLSPAGNLLIGLFITNLLIVGNFSKKTAAIQRYLTSVNESLFSIHDTVKHILSEDWKSSLLKEYIDPHMTNKGSEAKSILLLNKIINRLDLRLNMFAGTILNGVLLWDIKVLRQLLAWKSTYEQDVYKLIKLVGEMETLNSLANWASNHPHYTYAQINEADFHLVAQDISHPLINYDESVPNHFTKLETEYVSIITGSNMSGKSTFLRTIGINMILAYTGTKVAAKELDTSLVQVVTYMRIKDVLEENVSTFKAELNRVDLILRHLHDQSKCLYLVDEMLRGTNSKDKLNGSIAITKEILNCKGYAMIATHDIKLAEYAASVKEGVQNYYFDIEFEGQDLKFDYKIKEGICTSFNASFLLNQLGLDVQVD